jgi:hypothetical protein
MANEQIHNDVALLTQLAGLPVPDERLPALTAGLAAVRAQADPILSRDYGRTEPASRFHPPVGQGPGALLSSAPAGAEGPDAR